MKKLSVLLSVLGAMVVFGFGFTMNAPVAAEGEVEQIHLSCWDQEGTSSVERLRLVLNKSLNGLVWFSNYQGAPTGEGTLAPGANSTGANLAVNVVSAQQSFIAEIPTFVFQPHIRSLKMKVDKGDTSSALECRKINLQKRQSDLF